MLDFLTKSKYKNPTSLVQYQDSIVHKPGINLLDVDKYISELNKYNIVFQSFFGFNAVPKSNIFIRQNLILSTLHYLKNDKEKAKEYKIIADDCFVSLIKNLTYQEGFSYFLYVKEVYRFYLQHVPPFFAGNIDLSLLLSMEKVYSRFASPDNKLPFTDTAMVHQLVNQERLTFHNDLYSCHYMNNQSTYVFVNHNAQINKHSKNLHVNYEFGHIVIFHAGKWLLMHPGYPGFDMKQKTKIKESWNNNIIFGEHCKEPYWRYLPKKSLEWSFKDGVHNFKIGKDITRKIEILNNMVVITDNGGEYSSFNLTNDCKYDYFGKLVETVGYHSSEYGKVEEHKRLKISGNNRIFSINF